MNNPKIAIIGLGYVGLPLAVEFSKKFNVTGFDTDQVRIDELKNGFDRTNEISSQNLKDSEKLILSSSINDIILANVQPPSLVSLLEPGDMCCSPHPSLPRSSKI